jgi:hypothetical protein
VIFSTIPEEEKVKIWSLLAVLIGLPVGGLAGNITLYNTGVDAFGAALADGNTDPHYTDTIGGNTVFVIPQNGAWAVPGSPAKYIAPDPCQGACYNGSFYTLDYVTSFDLTGFDPSSVLIQGGWSTDNFGNNIFVNGNPTGNTSPGFSGFSSFTLSGASGFFTSGINTLDFQWGNSGGPGGLAVVFTSATADAAITTAPEPASLVLLGVGLATLGLAGRRKRSHRQ